MSVYTPPPPQPSKKRGWGCCGCGCFILGLLVLLFLGLVGGVGYLAYKGVNQMTQLTAASVPNFDGGDDVYNTAQQKIATFNQGVKNHQASTLQLSADEINTMIERNPGYIQSKMHLFVTMQNDEATIQASIPCDVLLKGYFKDHFINGTMTFGITFDSDAKEINFDLRSVQVADKTVLGAGADDSNSASEQAFMKSFMPAFNQSFNQSFKKTPEAKELLENAKSIEIKDGQLVIETE